MAQLPHRFAGRRAAGVGWPAWGVWALGWCAMGWLDGTLDLSNLAMVLVLSSAIASLWMPGWTSALSATLAVLAFNWTFVPPRRAFSVDLQQHVVLLAAMLGVNWIVSALMLRQRRLADGALLHARRESQLRTWGDSLRDAVEPTALVDTLRLMLEAECGVPVAVMVLQRLDAKPDEPAGVLRAGEADEDQRAGQWLCLRQAQPLGPGSGRHEEQPDWYLPLRGRGAALGAAVLCGLGDVEHAADLRAHAQALCDQLGQALQRRFAADEERQAYELAQAQSVRNALLAAISHDYRTPLATIMGAASSLQEQDAKLDSTRRRALATRIVEEAARLARLTDNTLQLARLDTPGVELCCEWESAEELAGAALRRARARAPGRLVRARIEPGLPLLWCDAMLMSQLLENLVDNALKYSAPQAPVEIVVRREGSQINLAVRDRGPGVEPAWRARVFDVFLRGDGSVGGGAPGAGRSGAGVGLAVCRAIAVAHGGGLRLRPRAHGGSSFECTIPLREQPPPSSEGEAK